MNITALLKGLIVDYRKESPDLKFSLGIATTAIPFEEPFFSFPREIEGWGFYFHILCPSAYHANEIIESLNGYVDQIFLDVENKRSEFNSDEIEKSNPCISFYSIYPNDLTIQSCFDVVDHSVDGTSFIFGHGGLAFKFAFLMKQRGLPFRWRASRKSVSHKYMKMKDEFQAEECESLGENDRVFYNFSPNPSEFFINLVNYPNIKIFDVAGKGALANSFSERVSILDVSARLVNELSFILKGNKYTNNYGRVTEKTGISFVSGGYPGCYGDLVVDTYREPGFIIGVSNGAGGFLTRINQRLVNVDIFKLVNQHSLGTFKK